MGIAVLQEGLNNLKIALRGNGKKDIEKSILVAFNLHLIKPG